MRANHNTLSLWRQPWLSVLGICLAIFFLAGCGDSDNKSSGGSSSGGGASLYTKVIFHFEGYDSQASASAKVQGRVMPQGTTQVRFSGYQASKKLLYGSQTFAAAENITLTDVNVFVSDFLVEYLTSSNQVLALTHSCVALKSGAETTVNIKDYSELKDTVKSFTVEPTAASAVKGYGYQFAANLLLNDAFSAPVTADSTWTSADETVAAFNDTLLKGYVSALSAGQSEITAQYAGFSATSQLTVTEAVAAVLEVVPNETNLTLGQECQLSLNCLFSDGTRSDITEQASWQSSASSVASVSASGLLKALSIGNTVITATDTVSGQSAQATISVEAAKVVALEVTPAQAVIIEGETQQYTATAINSDGTKSVVTDSVTWSCEPSIKASISAGGLLTAKIKTVNGDPLIVTAKYGDGDLITASAALVITDMSRFTVNNVYYQGVSGPLSAKVLALDSSDSDKEYQCSSTLVIPASEAVDGKINLYVFAALNGDNDKITSVTFYNTLSNSDVKCAFEWWDLEAGQECSETFDVAANDFAGGAGTSASSYLVANPRQLDNVRNKLDGYYKQSRDIDFENSCGLSATFDTENKSIAFTDLNAKARFYNGGVGWTPIGTDSNSAFTGTYAGQKHSIGRVMVNITGATTNTNAGLFGYAVGAHLSGIELSDTSFLSAEGTSRINLGGLCGCIENSDYGTASMEECQNSASLYCNTSGTSTSGYAFVGGLSGYFHQVNVSSCSNFGTVSGTSLYETVIGGGLSGLGNDNDISSCSNSGSIYGAATSEAYVGGLVGNCSDVLSSCSNSGSVSGTSTNTVFIGGLVGVFYTTISNSYSAGQLTYQGNTIYCGGLSGQGSILTNSFYLAGKGADKGRSNDDDAVGVSQPLTEQQIENATADVKCWDTVESKEIEKYLYAALNDGKSDEEGLWMINTTGDTKIVPANYPLLKILAPKT